jgi:hypothetical protein
MWLHEDASEGADSVTSSAKFAIGFEQILSQAENLMLTSINEPFA